MALTPVSPDAEIKQVTVSYDDGTGTFNIVMTGKVYAGRDERPVAVQTSTNDYAMVGAEPTFNDMVADLNDAAVAFNT